MARAKAPGSRGPSPAVSAASGFDPSRVLHAMERYFSSAKADGLTPFMWHVSEPLSIQLSQHEARPARIFGLPVAIQDEWSWGWMLRVKAKVYDLDRDAYFWNPPRDSDGSRNGGDACGSVHDGAGSSEHRPENTAETPTHQAYGGDR